MNKLFNLKEWLTLEDTAKYLSTIFSEEVNEADILRLALDGHLKLSVNFVNHATARPGKVVDWEDTEWRIGPNFHIEKLITKKYGTLATDKTKETRRNPPRLDTALNEIKKIPKDKQKDIQVVMTSLNLDGDRFINLKDEVVFIEGVWDLPMIGNEQLDVEHLYQKIIGGPDVTLNCIEGPFVEKDGLMCQLLDRFDDEFLSQRKSTPKEKPLDNNEAKANALSEYYPADSLPTDSVLVVRTSELRKLEASIVNNPTTETERTTLLKQIAVLSLAMAEKSRKYKRGDKPNANQIAEAVQDIIEALPGINKSGTGKSSVRESISTGLKLLEL